MTNGNQVLADPKRKDQSSNNAKMRTRVDFKPVEMVDGSILLWVWQQKRHNEHV